MEETQVWSLFAMQNVGISIYFVGMMFLVWVAFRVSKGISEGTNNIFTKVVGSVFGLGVVFFGLQVNAIGDYVGGSAAYSLSQLKSSGIEVSPMAENFIAMNGAGSAPEFSIYPGVIGVIWWLSVLIIILFPIWGPKSSN